MPFLGLSLTPLYEEARPSHYKLHRVFFQFLTRGSYAMRMPISSETRAALELLKEVQTKVRQTDDVRNNRQVGADLNALISVLESPVFQSILNIQDSLRELKRQVKSYVRLIFIFGIIFLICTGSTAPFNLACRF